MGVFSKPVAGYPQGVWVNEMSFMMTPAITTEMWVAAPFPSQYVMAPMHMHAGAAVPGWVTGPPAHVQLAVPEMPAQARGRMSPAGGAALASDHSFSSRAPYNAARYAGYPGHAFRGPYNQLPRNFRSAATQHGAALRSGLPGYRAYNGAFSLTNDGAGPSHVYGHRSFARPFDYCLGYSGMYGNPFCQLPYSPFNRSYPGYPQYASPLAGSFPQTSSGAYDMSRSATQTSRPSGVNGRNQMPDVVQHSAAAAAAAAVAVGAEGAQGTNSGASAPNGFYQQYGQQQNSGASPPNSFYQLYGQQQNQNPASSSGAFRRATPNHYPNIGTKQPFDIPFAGCVAVSGQLHEVNGQFYFTPESNSLPVNMSIPSTSTDQPNAPRPFATDDAATATAVEETIEGFMAVYESLREFGMAEEIEDTTEKIRFLCEKLQERMRQSRDRRGAQAEPNPPGPTGPAGAAGSVPGAGSARAAGQARHGGPSNINGADEGEYDEEDDDGDGFDGQVAFDSVDHVLNDDEGEITSSGLCQNE